MSSAEKSLFPGSMPGHRQLPSIHTVGTSAAPLPAAASPGHASAPRSAGSPPYSAGLTPGSRPGGLQQPGGGSTQPRSAGPSASPSAVLQSSPEKIADHVCSLASSAVRDAQSVQVAFGRSGALFGGRCDPDPTYHPAAQVSGNVAQASGSCPCAARATVAAVSTPGAFGPI